MFDTDNITRYIAGFCKISDKFGGHSLAVKYEFSWPIPLSFLQNLFGIAPDEPDEGKRYLISCYDLDKKKAEALQPFIQEKLDLDKYDFQLECVDKASYEKAKKATPEEKKVYTHEDLIRFIEAFPNEPDKNGEMWMRRFELQKPISLEFINKIFHVAPDDDLFWGDELNEEQAQALQPYFKEKLDTEKYLLYFTSKKKNERKI